MIQSIAGLITSLANLTKVGIEKIELKQTVDKAVNMLNWCYREIKRLNQIVFTQSETIAELRKELAKYKDNA